MKFIPYGRQNISNEDIDSVVDVLRSPIITQGDLIPTFEEIVSNYVNSKYGVAVNSATSGLHLACLAIGLKPGDWLWTSPNTFVASANCGIYCGANVDFVDIDQKTGLIDINFLKDKLVKAKKAGKLPKILVPVHFGGSSCDMAKIKNLSDKYGFKILEDASHAIGGRYLNNSPNLYI